MTAPTPEQRDALAEVLHLALINDGWQGHPEPLTDDDGLAISETTADAVLASPVLADMLATARADALRDARDALYRGEGPDLYADADLIYGEWLGNRADRAATEAGTDG